MDDTNWKLWCRLCASNDSSNIDIDAFPDQNLSRALNHLFSINLSEPSQLSKMICSNCHSLVERYIEFSQKVSKVQAMFLRILDSNENLDLKELKSEYKIDAEFHRKTIESPMDDTFYEPAIQLTQDDSQTEIDLFESVKAEILKAEGEEEQVKEEVEAEIKNLADEESVDDVNCTECHKVFKNAKSMKRHLRKQHGISTRVKKPKTSFVCEECGRVCINRARLEEHKIVHIEDRPFKCEQCGKSFKNKLRLQYHEDTHSETSYICTICGIRLNSKRTLNMHMVVHSEDKRFKCDYCGNEYKRAKALKAHLILHTGLKPYSCDFCDRTFANGSNCRSHKKKAHPVELAALEAAGKASSYTKVPELKQLRAALEFPNNTC